MADTKVSAMTAATAATASTVPVVQGAINKKVAMTGAGAAMIEASNATAQQALLGLTGGGAIALGGFTLTVPATGTAALLGIAQTFSAANIFSVNGAASTPAVKLTGTVFTGGSATTTKPLFHVEPTGATSTGWNTNGTIIGVNAPSGFDGDLISLQYQGTNIFRVRYEAVSGGTFFGPTVNGFALYNNQLYPATANTLRLGFPGGSAWTGLDLTSAAPIEWNGDTGLVRLAAAVVKVTDGSSSYGAIDALAYKVSGAAGIDFSGAVTNMTVVKGIVTAAS